MTISSFVAKFLIAAATAYVLVVIAMYFGQRSLLYPGASKGAVSLADPAPWGEWAQISTSDGETLAALYLTPGAAKAAFVYFHGNGDEIANYGFLADALAKRGYAFLAVSFRGFPRSTGSPTETGLLNDGLAGFDWLASKQPGLPVIVLGRSLGTGVAVNTAGQRTAAALVLVSPYASISSIAQRRYPFLPVSLLIKDSFRSDLRIGAVTATKLFLHGEVDDLIPIASGRALYEMAVEPKRFSVQQGRGHNDIWTPALVEEIAAFADDVIGDAGER